MRDYTDGRASVALRKRSDCAGSGFCMKTNG